MSQIISDLSTGIIKITEEYSLTATQSIDGATPYFTYIGEDYTLSFTDLERVESFTSFTFSATGSLTTRFLETSYRISRNGSSWTEWLDLDQEINNFPPFDPMSRMFIDVRFTRSGSKEDGSIRLISFELGGKLYRGESDSTVVVEDGQTSIISPPFVYKVFRIDDIEYISSGSLTNVEFKYRFSQDNTRTWTNWEPLTKENISTVRINPIRFFQVEYMVTNNSGSNIRIQDINLIGDFQNVSLDYQKTNLYGIRECCQSNIGPDGNPISPVDENGNPITTSTGTLDAQSCANDNIFTDMTAEERAKLYNPYQQNAAMNLLNKLSSDSVELFGHKVKYFITDPDGKGIDTTLHEFQLYNIVCCEEIKVSVENNQFPDNQIVMNQFDLTLFESFEVTIMKKMFKEAFGVQRRPSKEDILYFCDINRLFIVDHAQQFRNFNNAAIYYKVILKKYNKAANVLPASQTVEDRIKQLTNNSTIDQLFGIENSQDKKAVANKPQTQTLTRDPIRLEFKADIIKDLIENSTTIVSKQHYDFSNLLTTDYISLTQSVAAVTYKNTDQILKISDNLGFYIWFNVNNYTVNDAYNFYTQYDSINNLGWKVGLNGDNISLKMNSDSYTFSFTGATYSAEDIYENIWYCYVLNIDQRNRKIDQWIYKRNVDIEDEDQASLLGSTELLMVYENSQDMIPIEFELEGIDAKIFSSDIKITNIRLFSEVIPLSEHNKILNQYIIADDAKYLIFADNANTKITLANYPYNGD